MLDNRDCQYRIDNECSLVDEPCSIRDAIRNNPENYEEICGDNCIVILCGMFVPDGKTKMETIGQRYVKNMINKHNKMEVE